MDIISIGIDWVLAVQMLGGWARLPMEFVSFLGAEDFFLLVLPVLYWSVDSALGLRVGLALLMSASLNHAFKLWMAGPRPYWVDERVIALAEETTFGAPSGHSMNAMSIWGIAAAYVRKNWFWAVAVAIIVLTGVSRLYLGVHFPHDVLLGWAFGAILLTLMLRLWEPVAAWLSKLSFLAQIGVAFAASMVLLALSSIIFVGMAGWQFPADWMFWQRPGLEEIPNPVALDGILTTAGTLFGLGAGLAWMNQRGGYSAEGTFNQRALRYIVGLLGIAIFWYGLGAIFPREADLLSYALRYFRYVLVGLWVSALAPAAFIRLGLAKLAKS